MGCRGYFELMSVFMGLILAFAGMPLIVHMFSRRLRLHGGARSKPGTMMLLQAACRGVALKGSRQADKIRRSWTPALAHQPLTCAIVSTAPFEFTSVLLRLIVTFLTSTYNCHIRAWPVA